MTATDEQMAKLYREGMSLDAIGKLYGVTRQRVHQRLKRIGEPRRPRGTSYRLTTREES